MSLAEHPARYATNVSSSSETTDTESSPVINTTEQLQSYVSQIPGFTCPVTVKNVHVIPEAYTCSQHANYVISQEFSASGPLRVLTFLEKPLKNIRACRHALVASFCHEKFPSFVSPS